jgi:dihydrofolate reductase
MGKLIYLMNVSLDGFVETPDRGLDWTVIDDELHGWFNDHARGIEASMYGRRLYEVMAAYWPTAESDPEATETMLEFGRIWNATPRIVFSRTLESVDFNSRLVSGDVGEVLAKVRAEFDGDIEVGGPTLAAQFIERGLVDEYRLVVHPVVLGAGTPFFPRLERPIGLRLIETQTFSSGAVSLRYAAT